MRRQIAAAMLAPCLLLAVACSPAKAPPPDTANASSNALDDELLDTSPDSLAAPEDAGTGNAAEPPVDPLNTAR